MTQQNFVIRRQAQWIEFERLIRGGRKYLKTAAADFPRMYREMTQDLNTAKAHGFDPSIIERLNTLVIEGNQILNSARTFSPGNIINFILIAFPRTVRERWRSLGTVMLGFYGIAFFFVLLCVRFPDTAYEVLGEEQVWDLERMYNPESNHFLTPRNVSSDADMFGYYISQNISVAFRTFAGGIFAGFGSLVILGSNAIFLGTVAGHIINQGFESTFFSFIIAHSSFEFTAIVFSAQAGLLLGYRLFITRGLSRSASIKEAGKTALPLISGAALMLVIAAAIEGFWSSRHELPDFIRYGSGVLCWLLLLAYFLFAGRKNT